MKRITIALTITVTLLWMVLSPSFTLSQEKPPTCNWEVYFSPHGGCTDAIVMELNKAKTTILVQAYSFTSAPIAKALVSAHKRGVKVEVILDKSQRTQKYSSATFLYNQGIPVKIDGQHAIAHNKVMIIDGETVITGSFNFTKAAEESNAENLLIVHDKKLAERYTKNWHEHEKHSEVYGGIGRSTHPQTKPSVPKVAPAPKSWVNEYYSKVWQKIKKEWLLPEKRLKEMGGLETIITIRIRTDGKIQKLWYEKRSGNAFYDDMAWQAIYKAEPFPSFPSEIKEEALEIGIRFSPD
jgi:phosphatidylserine/phosphatidylglycerophosphate/cardiolipin synthase-like enzyme